MGNETRNIKSIIFNPDEVVKPLYGVLEECHTSIIFGLQTIELVNEIPTDFIIEDGFFSLKIGQEDEDIFIKKQKYKAWLIKKGFEDLVKGLEYTLREAYLYVSVFSKSAGLKTGQEFNEYFSKIRKKSLSMNIPNMMDEIESYLEKPWSYKKQILSINKARNCLVHRGGLVMEKDINDEIGRCLKLEWVKLKLFYEKEGEEIEIVGKTVVDAAIKLKREDNAISFVQGERIILDYKKFNEFVVTCFHFGLDLVACLPKIIK